MAGEKKMNEVVRKNWFLLLISLLVSIVIWIYVSYVVNPTYVKKINDIPIVYNNLSSDFESGKLRIIESNCDSVSVEIKGDRNDVASIKKDDIVANVDMISVTKSGNYSLQIAVNFGEDGVSVLQKTPQRCIIVVDDVVVEEREITVRTEGNLSEGFYINGDAQITPSKVKITGPKSYVNKVDRAEAVVDISDNDADIITNAQINLVDVTGKVLTFGDKDSDLPNVGIDISEANVHFAVTNKKEIEIVPDIKVKHGENAADVKWTVLSDKKLTIWGPANVVKNIDKIYTEPVDVSVLSDGSELDLKVIIPEGIETDYDMQRVKIRFNITK